MKRFASLFILVFFVLSINGAKAQPDLEFGFYGGLSTPNDEVSNVYNSSTLEGEENVWDLGKDKADLGYHLGARVRLGLTDLISFTGGIGINRFPESEIDINDPTSDTLLATVYTVTNIIPINAGVNIHFLKKFIGVYGIAELTYNRISYTTEAKKDGIPIPIQSTDLSSSENEDNIGYGIGAGFELDVELLSIFLEAKYNHTNLISSESSAENKSYVSLSLGIYL